MGKDARIILLPLPPQSQPQAASPPAPAAPQRAPGGLGGRSDDELMTLAATGMVDAFNALVRRHEGPLRRFCARLLGARETGDDIAQEVFLEVWRTCERYQGRGRFRAFLFTTARNRCLNEIRARPAPLGDAARRAALVDADAPVGADQVEALLAAERRQHLDRLVRRLPPRLRDAVLLRYSAELDFAEIAAIMKRSEDTVRGRVFRGLKRLRDWLDGAPERSAS